MGELVPDQLCRLGADPIKPFEPVSHHPELIDGGDAVSLQPLQDMARQAEPCDRAADRV